jgi:hypothetical protein
MNARLPRGRSEWLGFLAFWLVSGGILLSDRGDLFLAWWISCASAIVGRAIYLAIRKRRSPGGAAPPSEHGPGQ